MRKQINSLLHESNTAWQNRQDNERNKISEKIADMEPETWTFTLVNGTQLSKKILAADIEEEETTDETPEAE